MNKSKGLPRFYVVPTASDFAVYDQSECRCVTDLLMLEKEAKTLCRLLNNHAAPANPKGVHLVTSIEQQHICTLVEIGGNNPRATFLQNPGQFKIKCNVTFAEVQALGRHLYRKGQLVSLCYGGDWRTCVFVSFTPDAVQEESTP